MIYAVDSVNNLWYILNCAILIFCIPFWYLSAKSIQLWCSIHRIYHGNITWGVKWKMMMRLEQIIEYFAKMLSQNQLLFDINYDE